MGIRRNIAIQTATQTLARGLGFVFSLIVARLLGAEKFGAFSFAMGAGMLLSIFMDGGFDPLIVKWTSRGQSQMAEFAFRYRLLVSLVMFGLFSFAMILWGSALGILLTIFAFYFALQTLLLSHTAHFRGLEKMSWEMQIMTAQKFMAIVFVVLLLGIMPTAEMAALGLAASTFMALLASRWILNRQGSHSFPWIGADGRWAISSRDLKALLRESLPLMVVMIGWSVYFKIDVVLMKAYVSDAVIGQYSAAYKIMEGLNVLPSILLAAIFPALSQSTIRNLARTRRLLWKALMILIPSSLILGIAARFGAGRIMTLLFGAEYADAAPMLAVLALSILAIFPGYLVTQTLIALDKNALYAIITVLAAGLNISLNLLWLPRWGGLGAAWATVATEGFVTLACVVAVVWSLNQRNFRSCEREA